VQWKHKSIPLSVMLKRLQGSRLGKSLAIFSVTFAVLVVALTNCPEYSAGVMVTVADDNSLIF